ncbi:DUF1887 family protein [Campylobacter sp. US33a]|uniref:DUF1887 family protein n=1 Tax=Campylobacter sp. US33a TaxID=2498120 RepID=UPI001ABB74EE|nr:DUF1887 family protein [Campylobacter sp. US33a]
MELKLTIINRAVPGSGKTTALKTIEDALDEYGVDTKSDFKVHSTDEFFMVGDKYVFDIAKLNDYHKENLENFKESLIMGVKIVICDNTNLLPWQCKAYTDLARLYDYKIVFLNIEPKSLEEHMETQKVTVQNPSAHNVSQDILERNIKDWRIYNDLLDKNTPINPIRHRHYVWDRENKCRKDVGVTEHFDTDFVISLPSWWDKEIIKNRLREIIKSIGKYDCIFHTCGNEKMPLVWALRGLNAEDNTMCILIHGKDHKEIIGVAQKFTQNAKIYNIEVDVFNLQEIKNRIKDFIEKHNLMSKKIAFNLTGGTKIMLLAGLSVATELKKKAFYIDTNQNLYSLNDNILKERIRPLSRVSDFLKANTQGLEIIQDTDMNKIKSKIGATRLLFDNKDKIRELYKRLYEYIDFETFKSKNFDIQIDSLCVSLNNKNLILKDKHQSVTINGDVDELVAYIIGGWFEEYVYLELLPLVEQGIIYDLQINTKLRNKTLAKYRHRDYQEFDILFTDGYKLFAIECKSGAIKAEHIEKLSHIKRQYGELGVICILIALYMPHHPTTKKKIKDSNFNVVNDDYAKNIVKLISG